jgi:hypothetical protein
MSLQLRFAIDLRIENCNYVCAISVSICQFTITIIELHNFFYLVWYFVGRRSSIVY